MKKLLAMFLMLTMVVTTLMGVMVVDVNAAVNIDTSTDPDTINIQFGVASLPGKLSSSGQTNLCGIGNWYGYGYSYSDEDLAKDPTTTTINGTETEKVNFLSTSKFVNPLVGNMMKFDWKEGTITDDSFKANGNKTTSGTTGWFDDDKVSANYARIRILSPVTTGATTAKNTVDFGTITESKVYQYTFYAYTDPNTDVTDTKCNSSVISLAFMLGGSAHMSLDLNSNQITSAYGVPHKIDVVLSTNATTNYVNVYVDGVQLSKGLSKTNNNTQKVTFQPRFRELGLKSSTSMEFKDTDWYITLPSATATSTSTTVTENEVKESLVVVPKFNDTAQATDFRTDDYITGVIPSLDASIKGVLETQSSGDKIVYIDIANYNNPASLFNGTTSTVELVSRTTGEVVAPADATGTMDNYYFRVMGIYIIPEKTGMELSSLDYNIATKKATLNYQEFNSTETIPFVMLVGAYDAMDKMIGLDVSEPMTIDSANEEDGVKTKTFTANFGTLDLTKVSKYKVFAFNSLLNCKPIVENYSTPDK